MLARFDSAFENVGIGMMMALQKTPCETALIGYSPTNLMKALQRADGRIYGQGGDIELLGINPTTRARVCAP